MAGQDGFDRVVIVDATRSGAPPGTIHRIGVRVKVLESETELALRITMTSLLAIQNTVVRNP
jgi:Ni,Fe-hydrogenase maturation factor